MRVEALARQGGAMHVNRTWGTYGLVLTAAIACYAALGEVLRIVPGYVANGLHANAVWSGLTVGAPALTGAAMRPAGGRLADRVGPRTVMVAGAALMAVGTVPSFAPTLAGLVASRLLVGAGEALMMSAAVLWLLRLAGPARQALAIGHVGLANYAGLAIGPLLAGPLGGERHPAGVWVASLALPVVAAASLTRQRVPTAPPDRGEGPGRGVWRSTWRPGVGLLLVNVGYVALIAFGAAAVTGHHVHVGSVVLPVFAIGVIVSRTALGSIPDRVGPARTLVVAAAVEGVGLVVFGTATGAPLAAVALVALSVGQGLAVPSLGALALRGVPAARRGAAAGTFFAYFDAGVGLGGPLTGAVTHAFSAPTALVAAGVAVTLAIPIALLRTRPATVAGVPYGAPAEPRDMSAGSRTHPGKAGRSALQRSEGEPGDRPCTQRVARRVTATDAGSPMVRSGIQAYGTSCDRCHGGPVPGST